jgi:hypothetical protein
MKKFPWLAVSAVVLLIATAGAVGGLQVRHGARAVGLAHVKAEHKSRTRTIAKRRQDRTWR